jgi:plastocyanin
VNQQGFSLTSPAALLALALSTAVVAGMGAMMVWMMIVHGAGMGMHSGRDTSGEPAVTAAPGETVAVRMEDFVFEPGNLIVQPGTTVTWTNYDSAPHDATADDESWKTALLNEEESDSRAFDEPGTYRYYCSIHPSMKARITVRPQ